ncbi:hypothetical protein [Kitasatospora sp. A2-31]|nr:hypothetical protein [Kitasatospora sp. A2-31]
MTSKGSPGAAEEDPGGARRRLTVRSERRGTHLLVDLGPAAAPTCYKKPA